MLNDKHQWQANSKDLQLIKDTITKDPCWTWLPLITKCLLLLDIPLQLRKWQIKIWSSRLLCRAKANLQEGQLSTRSSNSSNSVAALPSRDNRQTVVIWKEVKRERAPITLMMSQSWASISIFSPCYNWTALSQCLKLKESISQGGIYKTMRAVVQRKLRIMGQNL